MHVAVGMGFIGRMLNGQVHGPFWTEMLGKGHLQGIASPDGKPFNEFKSNSGMNEY